MTERLLTIIRNRSRPLEPQATGQTPVLRPVLPVRAVLFDIYGTLFISGSGDVGTSTLHTPEGAFGDALAAVGIPFEGAGSDAVARLGGAIRECHRTLRGQGIDYPEVDIVDVWRTVLDRLAAESRIPHVDADWDRLKQLAVEYEVRANPVWPMPGAAECLQTLSQRSVLLGLVSNAQFFTPLLFPALFGRELDELGFAEELRLYSYEHRRAKPGAYLFERAREALARRGVPAESAVYVGNDMLNDIWAARQAGFRTALFAGDARSLRLRDTDPGVEGVSPDFVITRLDQLLDCLAEAGS